LTNRRNFDNLKYLMPKSDKKALRKSGTVLEALPSTHFRVKLDEGGEILCHLAGKLRMYRIKILPGDRVTVEITPYDPKRGRIIYRGK
jgi:translation initiation factor IF-1